MKTRQGFVSNSSSSSFIVNFDKDPTDIENLKEMMGDCAAVGWNGYVIPTEKVVEQVHKDIMRAIEDEATVESRKLPFSLGDDWDFTYEIKDKLMMLHPMCDDPDDDMIEAAKQLEIEHRIMLWEIVNGRTFESWVEENKYRYELTYSDECGDYQCTLEHGNIFRNIEDVSVISHH